MLKWLPIAAACALTLSACSKQDSGPPKVFLPVIMSPDGQNLDALRAKYCNGKEIELRDNVLTEQNFRAIFRCANYDSSLSELEPLFNNRAFPELLNNLNLVLKSGKDGKVKELKDTLKDWLGEGPQGNSRVDRLLPFLASMIKNPSFQAFLPVFDGILQAGRDVWNDLLPGLADVVYTDLFPDNVENAFVIFSTMSGSGSGTEQEQKPGAEEEEKNYAKTVKDVANFLQAKDVNGITNSRQLLELVNDVEKLQPAGTSLYQFIENMLEKGTISAYFLDSGAIRGEVVDPKLNEAEDPADVACPGLNETPEQRQECSLQRMFKRGKNGAAAPISQLAGLVAELQKDHPELLLGLATWFSGNGKRVINGLHGYVIKSRVMLNLSPFNVGSFLTTYARKQNLDLKAPVNSDQLADFVKKAFAAAEFTAFLETVVPAINQAAFGERNAALLQGVSLSSDLGALYASPELSDFSKTVIPEGTMALDRAIRIYGNKHRTDVQAVYQGKKQSIEKHLAQVWETVVKTKLGEDVVLEYVIELAQTFATQMANDFKNKGQPVAEWYFTSPYGNPGTTEMIVGYAMKELKLLEAYDKHKDWLRGDFANEVFAGNEDDKRAFQMLVDQVPNIVLYIRSGMSRTGGDLTRAMARDRDGYLVKTYVNLIVKVVETGWLEKGVRLVESWQNRPGKLSRARSFRVSDKIPDRRKYKMGVEAMERIIRSLIQPQTEGEYSTSTLSRLVAPLSSITGEARRQESERFLLTSAQQLIDLDDKQINDFFKDLNKAKPPGSVSERRETFRATADLLRDPNFPAVVRNLSELFKDQAVKPALDYLQKNTDNGQLPKVLLMIRRMLGFA